MPGSSSDPGIKLAQDNKAGGARLLRITSTN